MRLRLLVDTRKRRGKNIEKRRERVIDHLRLSRGSSISSKLPATEMVVVVSILVVVVMVVVVMVVVVVWGILVVLWLWFWWLKFVVVEVCDAPGAS